MDTIERITVQQREAKPRAQAEGATGGDLDSPMTIELSDEKSEPGRFLPAPPPPARDAGKGLGVGTH
ncbi:MAG: hypothetical protein ACREXS_14850 [Gammaproteobacteria bacterium]